MSKIPYTQAQPVFLTSLLIVAGALAVAALKGEPPPRLLPPLGSQPSCDEPLARQLVRAREPGRGREAVSPAHIPWRGWKDIFWRTISQVSENRLLAISAAVVFYGLLALFPAITALVSFYGLFTPTSTIRGHLTFLAEMMPAGAYSIVQDQIARVVAKGDAKLSLAFVFGFGLALWSATSGMKAIIDALNVVYKENEKRGFIRLNLISLSFTACAIARRTHFGRGDRGYPVGAGANRVRRVDGKHCANCPLAGACSRDVGRPRGALSLRPKPP